MSLPADALFELVRNYSGSVYTNTNDPLSVPRVQQALVAASLQGQYSVVFEYPKVVSQALMLGQQGNTPDFDVETLNYYKNAPNRIVVAFKDSKFSLTGLPDAGGFKISWSMAVPPTPVEETPVAETPVDNTPVDNVE
jgi:hypothetical protein